MIGKKSSADRKRRRMLLEINFIVALIRPFNCPSRARARGWQPRKENDASLAVNGERHGGGTRNK